MNKPGPSLLLLCAALLTACVVTAQTPKINGFSPSPACQGATITITGTNFKGVTDVMLGSKPAGNVKVVDDKTVTASIDGQATSGLVIVKAGDKADTAAANIDIKITPKPGLKDIGAGDNKPFTNCDGNSNYTLRVQDNSDDVPAGSTYDINWGDGTQHFNQKDWGVNGTATHKYTRQGYFSITLSISPPDGCDNKITQTFYNGANPLASLTTTTSTTGLCLPAPVGFIIGGDWKDNSIGTIYQLDYGDGNVQTLPGPLNAAGTDQVVPHTYTQSSCPKIDYTATLNVINGCFTTTYTLNQIIVREKPKADFEIRADVCLGQQACITDKTQAGYSGTACSTNTAYIWDFGDNTTSSSQAPGCHTYAAAGTYTITLQASNLTCGASTKSMQVTVHPISPSPVAAAGQAYCQGQPATPLKATGTNLQWYTDLTGTPGSPNAPTPNTSLAGNFTWYVTQTLPNDCESPRVAVPVTVAAAPQASISYPAICSTDQAIAATITGTKGGSFSSTAGLTIDQASGTINVSLSQPGNYTVTYTIPASAPCNEFKTTADITITKAPAAVISYSPSALCNAGGTVPVKLSGTGGGRFAVSPANGLPVDAVTGTLSPSGASTGNYTITYTMQGTGGCGVVTTSTSVSVSRAPAATISYSAVCTSDAQASVNLQGTAGGTFSAPAGLSINAATGTINPAASTPGIYTVTYTIAPSPPCAGFTTTAGVTVTKAPNASISYAKTNLCNVAGPAGATITGDKGGVFSISPTSGLPIDQNSGQLTPSGARPGNYSITYTLPGSGGCGAYTATTNVSVNSAPTATISYGAICSSDNTAVVTLAGSGGGTYSSATGLVIDATSGTISPGTSKPGNYTVTYTIAPEAPCPGYTATTNITITQAPAAAISYANSNLCNVSGGKPADVTLTGDKGGAFTISPANGLPIDQSTGQLTPSGSKPGNYTITYTLAAGGGCGVVTTTANVSVSSAPTATISYGAICSSDNTAAVTLTGSKGGTFSSTAGLVIDASTGTISPAASKPGLYTVTYTIAAEAPCPGYTATTNITITQAPTAAISYANSNLCNVSGGQPSDVSLSGARGGVFTISPGSGLPIDQTTGQLTPSGAQPGNYTITYTLQGNGGCTTFTTTANVSVSSAPTATIGYSPICSSDNTAAVNLTGSKGGTFSSTAGLVIDASTGTISPAASKPGLYTVTYTIAAEAPCPGYTATTKISITQAPTAAISYAKPTLCNIAGPAAVTITGDKGGIFSIAPAGLDINTTTGQLTPAGATPGNYTVTYTIQAAGGCNTVTATAAVSVSSAPQAAIRYGAICSSDATAAVTLTGSNGGTFSAPTGLTIDPRTGAITPGSSTPGTYNVTYTIAPEAPCPGFTAIASITIARAPAATISYAPSTLCNVTNTQQTPNPNVKATLTGDKGGVFTISPAGLSIDAATGNLAPSNAMPGNYTVMYTLQGTGGCSTFTATTQVTVAEASKASFRYPGSPYCGGTTDPQLPQFSGTAGGVFSAPTGLAIDRSTGAINPAESQPGSYTVTYTIAAEAPCPGFTATASVEISASPHTSFPTTEQSICSGGTASFVSTADVQQTVFNWVLSGTLPAGIAGPVSGTVTGSGNPIVLSYTNTSATGQALHIEVSPVNPSANPCPGAPVELTLHMNPVPSALAGDTMQFCMHATPAPLVANPDPGNKVKWYDASNYPLNTAPVPSTINPAVFTYYATQSNNYGCESPQAPFIAVIHPVADITASSYTNPTSCGLPSGTITLHIADLNGNPMPNTPLIMAYLEFNTAHTQLDTSGADGNITMRLAAGQFSGLIVNTYGCPSAMLDKTFELKDPTPPSQPLAGYNDTLCTGAELILSAASATSSIPGAINYVWVGPAFGSSPDTTQQTTITFPNSQLGYQGTYIVYAMQANCISPATSFPVTVRQGPTKPTIVTKAPLCVGDLLFLQAYSTIQGNYPLQFTWNGPGRGFPVSSSNASINGVTVADGGIYAVTVYAPATGCSANSDTLISIGGIPRIAFNPDTLHLPTGYKITLSPIIANSNEPGVLPVQAYMWSPADNLACNDSCSQPVLTVAGNACYEVKVTNVFGCAGTGNICVQAFCTDAQVFIPNAFTPRNGLPENRVFMVRASGIAAVRAVRVFNRWGKVVFEKHDVSPNDATQGWDGTINGKPADTGVYVYMVDVVCENGTPYTYKGNVTLLQ